MHTDPHKQQGLGMNEVKNILLQLDSDSQCSTFDSVVAVDAGADVLLRHGSVTPDNIVGLVHGAMFTRSPRKLKSTAIFLGGSDADLVDQNYRKVVETFFGPVRVSVVMDASGCNTTSAAAVHLALKHYRQQSELPRTALVFGSTGAVGRRVVQLLVQAGFHVQCQSRRLENVNKLIDSLAAAGVAADSLSPAVEPASWLELAKQASIVVGAGAAGVNYLDEATSEKVQQTPGVLVDLNAVPPAGIGGIGPMEDQLLGQRYALGALTVGNLKMTLHKAIVQRCFASNDQQFNLDEIFELVKTL